MAVKTCLQETMRQWGRPLHIRMDNGSPWGTQQVLPSALALWLVGLGVTPRYGRPAHPTDNACVERSQGVLAQWVEPHACVDGQMLQDRLAWASHTQRERYRLPNGYTRRDAYPDLYHNPRAYAVSEEAQLWSLQRVIDYLAPFHFRRKVEKKGQMTLFANAYSVGQQYARQYVDVQLDPLTLEWCVRDDYGTELRRHLAQELSYDLITQLKLAKRRRHD
jgi:hypothetical protein